MLEMCPCNSAKVFITSDKSRTCLIQTYFHLCVTNIRSNFCANYHTKDRDEQYSTARWSRWLCTNKRIETNMCTTSIQYSIKCDILQPHLPIIWTSFDHRHCISLKLTTLSLLRHRTRPQWKGACSRLQARPWPFPLGFIASTLVDRKP